MSKAQLNVSVRHESQALYVCQTKHFSEHKLSLACTARTNFSCYYFVDPTSQSKEALK